VPSGTKSILLIAQLSPPSTLVAARRVAGLTRYLARLGHRVTVLTSAVSGAGEIDGAATILRTRDLIATPLNWRREHFAALGGRAAETYSDPSRLESIVVPDIAVVSWLPFAWRQAVELARKEHFECVVTSSPPQSGHLIGAALKRRGVPWIAEFRDGWTFEPPRPPWPLELQRRADRALERFIVKRASAVVGVTAPIVEDLRERYGVVARLITNGFDPEEVRASDDDPLLDPRRHSLVHTGRMAIARSSPRPLLDAVRLLRRDVPGVAERLEVVFAGPLSTQEAGLLGQPDLAGLVRAVGPLDRPRALRLQRAADSLLVITEGSTRKSVATGKLFEYLAAGRPILVLGDETEAARIVEDAGAGFAAPADDPEQIAEALKRLVEDPPATGASSAALAPYSYPELARAYAGLIEEVCSRPEG
jgi:glycosyltransferase involved in cell wall biosynthesis